MKYLIFILSILFSFLSFSQVERCATDQYRDILKEKGFYKDSKKNTFSNTIHYGNYTIPVVVHVLYNNQEQNISDERIYSQIDVLNADYNASNLDISNVPLEFQDVVGNTSISFCLVQTDLNGNPFSGINRVYTDVISFNMSDDFMKQSNEGGVDAWDPTNYLNFWVCNLTGNLLGFATMPGDVPDNPELDGIVIDYAHFGVDLSFSNQYNLGRTGTHEVGHYLNLEHTFYAGCSDWDGCDDTPAISSPSYGCPSFPEESCGTVNMTMNYMDYTDDACMYMFTNCQANTMINTLMSTRSDLIAGANCTVSIDEEFNLSNLIYPNPVIDWIDVHVKNSVVIIFDLYGRQILSKYTDFDSAIDLSGLPMGNYILSVQGQNYRIVKK